MDGWTDGRMGGWADGRKDANPEKRTTAYDMAVTDGNAMLLSAATDKAMAGLRTCGLWPYGTDSFTDDDVGYAISDEVT